MAVSPAAPLIDYLEPLAVVNECAIRYPRAGYRSGRRITLNTNGCEQLISRSMVYAHEGAPVALPAILLLEGLHAELGRHLSPVIPTLDVERVKVLLDIMCR